jgi:hypothetical protein
MKAAPNWRGLVLEAAFDFLLFHRTILIMV